MHGKKHCEPGRLDGDLGSLAGLIGLGRKDKENTGRHHGNNGNMPAIGAPGQTTLRWTRRTPGQPVRHAYAYAYAF